MSVFADLLPGFSHRFVETSGTRLHVATGGSGPPVLLLHGHPQTHLTWHKVAPALVASGYSVVAPTCAAMATVASRRAASGTSPIPSARWRATWPS